MVNKSTTLKDFDFSHLQEYKMPSEDNPTGYVYYLFYLGHLVYIGQTMNVHSRILLHKKGRKMFDYVKFQECPVLDMDTLESSEIAKYCPIYNISKTPKQCFQWLNVVEDNFIFRQTQRIYRVVGNKIFCEDHLVGFAGAYIISICENNRVAYRYNTETHELKKTERIHPYLSYSFDFNESSFEFELCPPKAQEKPKLPNEYVFKFGMYSSLMASDVVKHNPKYIKWFEENVPEDKW